MPLFTSKKQALHELCTGTVVVVKEKKSGSFVFGVIVISIVINAITSTIFNSIKEPETIKTNFQNQRTININFDNFNKHSKKTNSPQFGSKIIPVPPTSTSAAQTTETKVIYSEPNLNSKISQALEKQKVKEPQIEQTINKSNEVNPPTLSVNEPNKENKEPVIKRELSLFEQQMENRRQNK